MNTKTPRAFLLGLMVIFIAAGLVFAQAGRGTAHLYGVVTDQNGEPLEGVQVTLSYTQDAGGVKHETKTDEKGEWSFLGLGTGQWELAVVMKGYEPYTQTVSVTQLARNPKVWVKIKKVSADNTSGAIIQDESSFIFLELGNQLYKDGKYDEAIAQYELFLEMNPRAYQVQLNIADAYREKGEFDKATELYNKIIELSSCDPTLGKDVSGKALAGIGDIYLKQNKLAEAQEYFRQSIERSPKDEILAYNVGEIYFSNQNLEEAQKYFELATQIKPEWPDPYLKMGYVYLNKADNDSAAKMFEKFLTLEPEGERAALAKNILNAIKK
ncbi:MAG: tetratricopeptide repeat protein [Candidatus Aminicenantes bacterium]|nr:tetratricopeptide repeat protein [Candidatus Aminicenantes bacterium]